MGFEEWRTPGQIWDVCSFGGYKRRDCFEQRRVWVVEREHLNAIAGNFEKWCRKRMENWSLSNCIADFLSFYIVLSSSSCLFSFSLSSTAFTSHLFVILSIYVQFEILRNFRVTGRLFFSSIRQKFLGVSTVLFSLKFPRGKEVCYTYIDRWWNELQTNCWTSFSELIGRIMFIRNARGECKKFLAREINRTDWLKVHVTFLNEIRSVYWLTKKRRITMCCESRIRWGSAW